MRDGGHHPVRYGWYGRAPQILPRERANRGNRERVITECDLARVGQLYDQHRRVASSRGHAAKGEAVEVEERSEKF